LSRFIGKIHGEIWNVSLQSFMITWVGNTDGGLLASHTTSHYLLTFMKNRPPTC